MNIKCDILHQAPQNVTNIHKCIKIEISLHMASQLLYKQLQLYQISCLVASDYSEVVRTAINGNGTICCF